ncbi:DUF3857 domain-containing protein [Ferruginibacter sp.]
MIKSFYTLLLFFIMTGAFAQQPVYTAANISDAMKKNAYSVKREEHIEFEVKAIDKAYYRVHKVVTVLNEAGKEELFFYEFSDQFQSLNAFAIHLFDANGKSIRKYNSSDLTKQATGEGLVPDGKVYYLNTPAPSYPVTIQIDYELKYNGLLDYPDFEVQLPEQSVEHAEFIAKIPPEMDLRFKAKNSTITPVISSEDKYKVYKWTADNLPALEYEEGSVSRESRYPKVLISPNKFALDDYEGDMTSWQNFGKWYGSLAKDAVNLTEERKQFFKNMVKDIPGDKEKIKTIYTYLQNNFRYVSIQLGIGGFKPFAADFVDKKKYGDCKALSNYVQACLAAVGIKSYQALINASYNKAPVDPDFPNNSFNHVIVCVPGATDSVWLECTSTTTDFGVLGNFTENRNALLITEDGGKLVPTPKSHASENCFSASSSITLNEDGSGSTETKLFATGEYRQEFLHDFFEQKKDDQKKFLVEDLGFLQPDEFVLDYDKTNRTVPVKLQMNIEKIPEFTAGNKQFLNPRVYSLWRYALPRAENRTQDFYFRHPFVKTDTTIYNLPAGYGLETLPKPKQINFEFGNFSSTYQYDEANKRIITTARLELDEYKIPAAKFLAAKKFFNDVLGEYSEKIVIKKL